MDQRPPAPVLAPRACEARTIAEAFRITAEHSRGPGRGPHARTTRRADLGRAAERVDALAGGLRALGVGRGDTVALMLINRPEFHLADLAVMTLGATPFSIYQTSAPDQIQYVVERRRREGRITEQASCDVLLRRARSCRTLEHVVVVEGGAARARSPGSRSRAPNPGFDAEARWRAVEPERRADADLHVGHDRPAEGRRARAPQPAGRGRRDRGDHPVPRRARVISWLPAAHIAERAAHHYLPIVYGMTITCCDDPRQVIAYLPQVRPKWFFAVPRIWEKLKAGLEAMIAGQPDEQREPARRRSRRRSRRCALEQAGEEVPEELAAARGGGRRGDLRRGCGRCSGSTRSWRSTSAPRRRRVEVLEFFHAIGIPLAELWGMSRDLRRRHVNPPGKISIGTVGPPAPGVEITLAEDGEVLMRCDVVMRGYRNQPEKTAETIDSDGWLHTGDIGEFDEDGYLKIVDRKKEIIINAAGKNMSPANIEATLKGASPLIGQACASATRGPTTPR